MSQGERDGNGLIIIEIIEIGTMKFLARDADGIRAWNGENWTFIADNATEPLFLENGVDNLPQSTDGLLDNAEILVWTDRANVLAAPQNFTLNLVAEVTAPQQTVVQTVPFEIPENAVINNISVVTDEQNGGTVEYEYELVDGGINFAYTLNKPTADAVADVPKINIY
jgi:hypothetical protein